MPRLDLQGSDRSRRRLVERFAGGEWGHVGYGKVTGSARNGTATVTSQVDLTAAEELPRLVDPPDQLPAFAATGGNGGTDGRLISAVTRAGRLWATATTTCLQPPEPDEF